VTRRVLVTGADSGLGAALTAVFRARGDRVLATDLGSGLDRLDHPELGLDHPELRLDHPEIGLDHPELALDVTDDDAWAEAVAWVERRWGGLDVLVNNAGIAGGGRVDVCTIEEWQRLLDVNLLGVVRGSRAFAPLLKRQGSGRIVNIASLAGLVHPPGMGSYNAVKAAVVAFSETLSHELAPYGVGCTAVCPSYFRTGLMRDGAGSDTDVAAKVAQLVEQSPITADDIAAAVLRGIDEGADLVVPDEPARQAVALKLHDRAAYDAEMRRTATRLRERDDA
jgi:NAD(P)-dependent dehydrogenase (short-subunit alcohol dehydrogenase family)